MVVLLPTAVLARYERFSLYNSPFPAHDRGCAIDLYNDPACEVARSPVAGEVLETHTVRAPSRPYAEASDHLILVDCADRDPVARILHVDPSVEPGDTVAIGDSLGRLVRAGFFAPWVDNHVHLGFRAPDANPYRATGSLPIALERAPLALDWDGSGTVVERGETYAVLDSPACPPLDEGRFAGIEGLLRPSDRRSIDRERPRPIVLDGGLAHYENGGGHRVGRTGSGSDDRAVGVEPHSRPRAVELLGTEVGVARGRTIDWHSLSVRANDQPITGLSLVPGRDRCGAKLVCPERSFDRGERVCVSIRRR